MDGDLDGILIKASPFASPGIVAMQKSHSPAGCDAKRRKDVMLQNR